jgi:hypothetical protein
MQNQEIKVRTHSQIIHKETFGAILPELMDMWFQVDPMPGFQIRLSVKEEAKSQLSALIFSAAKSIQETRQTREITGRALLARFVEIGSNEGSHESIKDIDKTIRVALGQYNKRHPVAYMPLSTSVSWDRVAIPQSHCNELRVWCSLPQDQDTYQGLTTRKK